jgi:hypothetical protein
MFGGTLSRIAMILALAMPVTVGLQARARASSHPVHRSAVRKDKPHNSGKKAGKR